LPISADFSAGHLDEDQAPQLRRKVVRPASLDLRFGGEELAIQAPTSGRLAAAIATTCAIRRLIRAGVERNRKAIRCIE
jgi:PleD family two-component response regulator